MKPRKRPGPSYRTRGPAFVTDADITKYRIVLLKSATHFRAWFQGRAKAIITANTPGITTEDFSLFPYRKLRRPIYPLDPGMTFAPKTLAGD
ncbi:MAG: MlrC C-terminal domain-containing protein [Lachnospiraceae bacterium]|nr:MlrC C-terminal domain-containing protein [Lachnospiraceae bacterium]